MYEKDPINRLDPLRFSVKTGCKVPIMTTEDSSVGPQLTSLGSHHNQDHNLNQCTIVKATVHNKAGKAEKPDKESGHSHVADEATGCAHLMWTKPCVAVSSKETPVRRPVLVQYSKVGSTFRCLMQSSLETIFMQGNIDFVKKRVLPSLNCSCGS